MYRNDLAAAYPRWLNLLKRVAKSLNWQSCERCSGSGEGERDICVSCYGIGYEDPD